MKSELPKSVEGLLVCKQCHEAKSTSSFYKRNDLGKYRTRCKECFKKDKEIHASRQAKYMNKYPWIRCYQLAKQRCVNPKNPAFKWYGGKGIKFLMSKEDFKFLWFRDKAYLMDNPSIDRKKSNDNYELSNCQFIELRLNSKKDYCHPYKKNMRAIDQLTLEGNFIKRWESVSMASRETKTSGGNIYRIAEGITKKPKKFIWRYAGKPKFIRKDISRNHEGDWR